MYFPSTRKEHWNTYFFILLIVIFPPIPQHFPFSFSFWSCARNLFKMKPFCILRLAAPWHLGVGELAPWHPGVGELPTQRRNNMKNKQNILKKYTYKVKKKSEHKVHFWILFPLHSIKSILTDEYSFQRYWKIPKKTVQFSITWTRRELWVH